MDEKRYWSVRDACWLPSPRPLSLLETPWSLRARDCRRAQPCPTPEQDLRWLTRPTAAGEPQVAPVQAVPAQREGCAVVGAPAPVSEVPARRT